MAEVAGSCNTRSRQETSLIRPSLQQVCQECLLFLLRHLIATLKAYQVNQITYGLRGLLPE